MGRHATRPDVPFSALGPQETGKGIAEAVLCPIAPAIANAVAHATGHRFRELPITPDKILKALG